jgi:hypothetical protein
MHFKLVSIGNGVIVAGKSRAFCRGRRSPRAESTDRLVAERAIFALSANKPRVTD